MCCVCNCVCVLCCVVCNSGTSRAHTQNKNLRWALGTGRNWMKTASMTGRLSWRSRWYFNRSLNTSRRRTFSMWWSLVCGAYIHIHWVFLCVKLFMVFCCFFFNFVLFQFILSWNIYIWRIFTEDLVLKTKQKCLRDKLI